MIIMSQGISFMVFVLECFYVKIILYSLEDMIRFAKSVKEWLKADPENVIVVHCKGGKGKN